MKLLWQQPLTAREITQRLNQEKKSTEIAHSTVQTLLRKLEAKGAVSHEQRERTFVFYSLVQEEKALHKATRDFVDRIFAGSVPELVSYLLKNEKLSGVEIKTLRKLIAEKGKK